MSLSLPSAVVSGGWSSLPGSELPVVLRRFGLPSAEGGPGDVAGEAAEQSLLLDGNIASMTWFYSRLIYEDVSARWHLPFAVSGSLDNRCRRQPSDTTIEFCVWRSVINPSTHLCLIQEPKPKHVLVFQHIPLYLKSPDEEDDYFNLQRGVRQNLLDRFKKAGRTPWGHKI